MTDRDVVERVGAQFGTSVMAFKKGKYRTEFAATLKGQAAVALMNDLKPLMGKRRRQAIEAAVRCHRPPRRKLNFEMAEKIRRRYAAGKSVASLARTYKVARQTIYPILRGDIYRTAPARPWRTSKQGLPQVDTPPEMSPQELHWLAGWLEGEGSFLAPPPSDRRQSRISGKTRDEDVVTEVGRLLRVKPIIDRSGQLRDPTWSVMWRVLLKGQRATALMLALEPLMGRRRTEQIRAAIAAAARIRQGDQALVQV